MMLKSPLISCLCITKNTVFFLKRSIECFRSQTYHNKELIIVRKGEDPSVTEYLDTLEDDNITYFQLPENLDCTLGDLRNFSIEKSNGDYFCIWDDDDWQHYDRLRAQLEQMLISKHNVSVLTNLLAYNDYSNQGFFTSFRLWEGTLLCDKKFFQSGLRYPSLKKGEDSGFLKILLKHTRIYPVVSSVLYIYVYHGDNTWGIDHFKSHIFKQPLSLQASNILKDVLSHDNPVNASEILGASCITQEIDHFYKQ